MTNYSNQTTHTSVNSTELGTDTIIWRVFSPILLVVGTIGNILSIIILSRKSMRRFGVTKYLICLALSDLLVLYTGLLRQWINYRFDTDVRDIHTAICRVNLWLVYFSLDMSAWILASVTVKRAVVVWKPLTFEVICTGKVFVVNIVLLVVVLITINGHFLFGVGLVNSNADDFICENLSEDYDNFQSRIFPWIDLFFFCLGPFLCHVVGNTLIIIGLLKAARTATVSNLVTCQQARTRQRDITSMTTMLLCLNAIYLICTLPISIYFIEDALWEQDEDEHRRLWFAWASFLMYLNTSTNFITYIVSGRRFRAEVRTMLFGVQSSMRPSFILTATRASLTTSLNLVSSYRSSGSYDLRQ